MYTTGWIVTVSFSKYAIVEGDVINTTVKVVTSAACIVLAIIYRFVCAMENKKRDKSGVEEAFDHAYEDDLTDVKNKQFRYTL